MYLISMDVATIFSEMLLEVGSSQVELTKLSIGVNIVDSKITLWSTKIDKAFEQRRDLSWTVLFVPLFLNLHDPESFNKLSEYIIKMRQIHESKNANI